MSTEAKKGCTRRIWYQTVQTTVNAPDARIPSGANSDKSIQEVEALKKQEEGSGMTTTDGYVIDEAGKLANFAIEPEMYEEEK